MRFAPTAPWALPPSKIVPDVKGARAKRDAMRSGFTHVRAERQPEFCPPWIQGQTVGWQVTSPVDVELGPLPQHEVAAGSDPGAAARAVNATQVWNRTDAAIAVGPSSWLNAYEFEVDGARENMFIPNGLGTVEWRLGWAATELDGFGLLVVPTPSTPQLGVEIGYLSAKVVERLGTKGVSIAIKPSAAVSVRRGQEIARLVPISPEALAL